jgi:hypothetical protein
MHFLHPCVALAPIGGDLFMQHEDTYLAQYRVKWGKMRRVGSMQKHSMSHFAAAYSKEDVKTVGTCY